MEELLGEQEQNNKNNNNKLSKAKKNLNSCQEYLYI